MTIIELQTIAVLPKAHSMYTTIATHDIYVNLCREGKSTHRREQKEEKTTL